MSSDLPPGQDWRRHRAALLLLARGLLRGHPALRQRSDASDLVQQALLRAGRADQGCPAPTEAGVFRWLHAHLVNAFREGLSRETAGRRDVTAERLLDDLAADSGLRVEAFLRSVEQPAPDNAAREGCRVAFADALLQLPAEELEAVIGHDLEGRTLGELAGELGVGKSEVARRLAAGRRRLRGLLTGHQ